MAFGCLLALEAWGMTRPTGMVSGQTQLETYFTGPDVTFHFAYPVFAWLPWLSPRGFEAVLWLLGATGIGMALGLWYRVSAVLALVCWGYLFAVESTRTYWQSYHYLELLLGFLLAGMPAHRRFSLDAWRHPPSGSTVPFWTLVLLRGQLGIAYFYAGVAKLNLDWLVDGAPIRWAVQDPGVTEPYRRWLSPAAFQAFEAMVHGEPFIRLVCLAGAGFDLTVGFLLLVRRTRILGFVALLLFHATNHLLLYDDIDWFPWLGMTTASVFLDPDWPSRWGRWARKPRIRPPDWGWLVGGALGVPGLGLLLGWKLAPSPPPPATAGRGASAGMAAAVLGWLGL
ncbi:MAG: HTTM domain-containing protein, partial [Verrucomicrobiota bacterium]